MTPTMCMKVDALNGRIFRANGLMYAGQLANRLKYLSRPARNGPTPSPIRSAHHACSNRESNPLCIFSILHENGVGGCSSVTTRADEFEPGTAAILFVTFHAVVTPSYGEPV